MVPLIRCNVCRIAFVNRHSLLLHLSISQQCLSGYQSISCLDTEVVCGTLCVEEHFTSSKDRGRWDVVGLQPSGRVTTLRRSLPTKGEAETWIEREESVAK